MGQNVRENQRKSHKMTLLCSIYSRLVGQHVSVSCFTASMNHSPNAGTALGHRLRRWLNVVPTLDERLVFAGLLLKMHIIHI